MKITLQVLLLFCTSNVNLFAQNTKAYNKKGQVFINWGYNRSNYAKSDIYFKGKGYEFTLNNVVAHNRPTQYKLKDYFNLTYLTIPQYNFKMGYFFKDNWSISIGTDHMKYVMVNDQMATISGHISSKVSDPEIVVNPAYVGNFNNTPFKIISTDFLVYEHTDGFNYAHFELDHFVNIYKTKNNVAGIDWNFGVGMGLLIPRTDAHLFTIGANHFWNIAGYGISAKTGMRFDITKNLYIDTDLKGGFTNLTKVKTTGRESDFARQKIWFLERYFTIGFKFGR